jgi:hypothetical protein
MCATAYGVNIWYNVQQGLAERPTAWLFARAQRRRAARGQPVLDARSRLGAGLATQIKMSLFSAVGLGAVYLVWAVMAWIIFTYGSLVYRLMGDAAQAKFAHGWGVGLAISQATQCKDMLLIGLQSAAVLTVLETLWLVRAAACGCARSRGTKQTRAPRQDSLSCCMRAAHRWATSHGLRRRLVRCRVRALTECIDRLLTHHHAACPRSPSRHAPADFASVQASMLGARNMPFVQRMRTHVAFYSTTA